MVNRRATLIAIAILALSLGSVSPQDASEAEIMAFVLTPDGDLEIFATTVPVEPITGPVVCRKFKSPCPGDGDVASSESRIGEWTIGFRRGLETPGIVAQGPETATVRLREQLQGLVVERETRTGKWAIHGREGKAQQKGCWVEVPCNSTENRHF